jgi:hypothetical protein
MVVSKRTGICVVAKELIVLVYGSPCMQNNLNAKYKVYFSSIFYTFQGRKT